ncbi:MAG: hypothetical protein JWM51_1502, partial [Microbacteriaceae bacterium]|nr:hypothetical protein [Microbacteriaceae bacterium]
MNDIDADAVPADPGAGPSAAAELERLRRLAFGRTTTDADEVAAAEARLILAQWQAERAAEAARAESEGEALAAGEQSSLGTGEPPLATPDPGAPTTAEQVHPLAEDEHPTRARRRWREWMAPAAVGLLVGAVAVGAVSIAMGPASSHAAG